MMKRLIPLLLIIAMAAPLAGCIAYPPEPTAPEVWSNGHYTRFGEWIPGHWE